MHQKDLKKDNIYIYVYNIDIYLLFILSSFLIDNSFKLLDFTFFSFLSLLASFWDLFKILLSLFKFYDFLN